MAQQMYDNVYYNQGNEGFEAEPLYIYTAKTFAWMFLGLLVTCAVALAGFITGFSYLLFYNFSALIVITIAELVVVMVLSACIKKLSVLAARFLFFTYAVLNGVVFSAYFAIYQMYSLLFIFAMTCLYFGAMAAFGYFTKTDLSKIRYILMGGLVFLLLFGLLSFFLNLQRFEVIVSFFGVLLFLGFTAYDTQKIKAYHAAYSNNPEMASKASIFSALQLYLDFINLFLYLLRILGKRR